MNALEWALRDVRAMERESAGPNRSPHIDEINRFVANPLGSPYCAAGVSWCFHQAGAIDGPKAGSAMRIRDWFRKQSLLSYEPDDLLNWKGALFGWTNPDGHGHVGFIAKRLVGQDGRVVSLGTAEYNASPAGDRDGEGVFALERPVNGRHRLWFLNCGDVTGGCWW